MVNRIAVQQCALVRMVSEGSKEASGGVNLAHSVNHVFRGVCVELDDFLILGGCGWILLTTMPESVPGTVHGR